MHRSSQRQDYSGQGPKALGDAMAEDRRSDEYEASRESGAEETSFSRPPILAGYVFEPKEAYKAREDGRLLSVRLELDSPCALKCSYCRRSTARCGQESMPYERLVDVVREAHSLGAVSIVIIGGGEPTSYPRFADLVDVIHCLGLVPVVFTNCLDVTSKLARFLYQRRASVVAKLDSLRDDVQDELTGVPGSAVRMRRGLENLLAAGFSEANDSHGLRLGASFVACRSNMDEISDIFRFCRSYAMFPNMELFTSVVRSKRLLGGRGLSWDEIRRVKLRLLKIDRQEYGYDWLPFAPLTTGGCLQHMFSLYVTFTGDVRPCAPVGFDEHPNLLSSGTYPHNVSRRSLRAIHEDPLFRYVRDVGSDLEGRCSGCEHGVECVGCRGYAYSLGVMEGKGPLEALRGECKRCFR